MKANEIIGEIEAVIFASGEIVPAEKIIEAAKSYGIDKKDIIGLKDDKNNLYSYGGTYGAQCICGMSSGVCT